MTHPPNATESVSFIHLDTMIAAYASATTEDERLMYLRGITRALEQLLGQLFVRVAALVEATTAPK